MFETRVLCLVEKMVFRCQKYSLCKGGTAEWNIRRLWVWLIEIHALWYVYNDSTTVYYHVIQYYRHSYEIM